MICHDIHQISKLQLHESRPGMSNIVQLFVVLDLADLVPQRSTKILVPPSMVVLAVRLEFSIRESRNGWQIEMDQLEVCLGV